LTLEAGCFEALITSSRGAARATIALVAPPVTLAIDGAITLTPDKKKGDVYGLAARDGAVRAYGALWDQAGTRRVRGALPDGDAVALRALQECLAHAGIPVRDDAPAPADAEEVFAYRTPLASALLPMMRDSSNFHAEQLARALGAHKHGDGSCAGGSCAVARELRDLVGEWPDVVIDDTAGLSRGNRVSPAFVVTVLAACAAAPWAQLFCDSLPSGGEGTLDKRFKNVPFAVRAKTGTLRDACTLSGYLDQAGGARVAFAVFMNVARGGRANHGAWRDAQDRIVAALANM
jgi:D-alanyl-D-alanine carboxypeptidase/D-alanyl-D-alanine-endopeptidase (penicillin-binding protein 4)